MIAMQASAIMKKRMVLTTSLLNIMFSASLTGSAVGGGLGSTGST